MKTVLKLMVVSAVAFAGLSWASEKGSCILPVTTAGAKSTGLCDIDAGATGLVTMWGAGANVWMQCPGIKVCVEPRGGTFIYSVPSDGGPIFADAGGSLATCTGNVVADFASTSADPFVIELIPSERNISLKALDDAGTCTLGPTPRAKH